MYRLFFAALISAFSIPAFAVSGVGGGAFGGGGGSGDMSFGAFFGIVNTTQTDLNTMQAADNVSAGGPITTSQLNQAWEGGFQYVYRWTGTIYSFVLRPSYFYERQDGKGNNGSYTYGVQGWTFFPILRLYPMENDIMKFYMNFGLGYGEASAVVGEGTDHANFGSGAFGALFGMGVEFFLTSSSSLSVEGDYRYLDYDRNLVSSTTNNSNFGQLSHSQVGFEAELGGRDVDVKMSGLMFLAGYNFYF